MKKRWIAFILSILMIIMIPVSVLSDTRNGKNDTEEEETTPVSVSVKTGSQEREITRKEDADEDIREDIDAEVLPEWEEIRIGSAEELISFSKNCRLDTWSRNKHVYLTKDISLDGTGFEGIPTFGGTFDGQGYEIRDLELTEGTSYTGLFSRLQEDAVVKDLRVNGRVTPEGSQVRVGGICGDNSGVIINCVMTGIVSGNDYVGGIAGFNELSGIISDCSSEGYVSGVHFTGGITGENMGSVLNCANLAKVNTTEHIRSVSPGDFDIETYAAKFIPDSIRKPSDEAAFSETVVDCGGIAGLSIGVISGSRNEGAVGYERVGYNIGGISGRQSGYITGCENRGQILGRKDIGGIAGQAEPYVTVDLSQDIAYQLTDNIGKLHDLITATLNDAGKESDALSSRLSVIQEFTGNALADSRYIADNTVTYANGVTGAVNEAFSRVDYILEETSKDEGVLDQVSWSAEDAREAAERVDESVGDLDLFSYMTEEERQTYENDKKKIKEATEEYSDYYEKGKKAFYNYNLYLGAKLDEELLDREKDLAFLLKSGEGYTFNRENLENPDTPAFSWTETETEKIGGEDFMKTFSQSGKWVHHNNETGEDLAFPKKDTDAEGKPTEDALADRALKEAAKLGSVADAKDHADRKYLENHPESTSYADDIAKASAEMTELILSHADDMTDEAREDARRAADSIGNAAEHLKNAGTETKRIVRTVSDQPEVVFPELDSEYREHTTSLADNLQGMNDNFGILNSEMNGAAGELLGDLSAVTDQFDRIMLLYTDAIDGALDRDYSNVIEDDSLKVAADCTDATIDSCINRGSVSGSLDAGGIAGTMAVEYDFDLESDVTGIKNADMNTTFIAKCVLRNNANHAEVVSEKSYAGGICGLQELGTVTGCGGFGNVSSASGNYAGGIAGSSLSYIVNCRSKCGISAMSYAGGIAGDGCNIYDCISIPRIDNAKNWYGAIAGHTEDGAKIRNNLFVSDELAGIDRVSYTLKASPVSYEKLMEQEGASSDLFAKEFDRMRVTFILDDKEGEDDGTVLGKKEVRYGEMLDDSVLSSLPDREDSYAYFEDDISKAVTSDETVRVGYRRFRTTLAGAPREGAVMSAILVDGCFREGDELETLRELDSKELLTNEDGTVEVWDIRIPEDGQPRHTLRYLPAREDEFVGRVSDRVGELKLYLYRNGAWEELVKSGTLGKYDLYDTEGNSLLIAARYSNPKRLSRVLIIVIISIIITLVITVILIAHFLVKRRRKILNTAKKIREATHEAARNIGSQNQIFYHGGEDRHGDPVKEEDAEESPDETPAEDAEESPDETPKKEENPECHEENSTEP